MVQDNILFAAVQVVFDDRLQVPLGLLHGGDIGQLFQPQIDRQIRKICAAGTIRAFGFGGNQPCEGLGNRPTGIGAESVAAGVIKFFHRRHQRDAAFADQFIHLGAGR